MCASKSRTCCFSRFSIYCPKSNMSCASGENCALAAFQSVNCSATTLFTVGLNSAKVWNRGFNWPVFSVNWPVFSVRMHKKSSNVMKLNITFLRIKMCFQYNSVSLPKILNDCNLNEYKGNKHDLMFYHDGKNAWSFVQAFVVYHSDRYEK